MPWSVPDRWLVLLLPGSVADQLFSMAAKIKDSCFSKWGQMPGTRISYGVSMVCVLMGKMRRTKNGVP